MVLSGTRLLRAIERFREWCDLEDRDLERRLTDLDREDPELARGIRDLLAEDRQAPQAGDSDGISLDKDRLGRWMAETVDGATEGASTHGVPDRIGDYRVQGILGVGGMGVVYRAEQDSPRRAVAVKVVHPTSLSEERRKRLRQEAEILGRLEHPGIARIYSAGSDDFGAGPQPFFAMEFVEGQSLTRYCEERGSDTTERIQLLVQVCEAVDHAHRLGIVHRDLKPDNVLVQADGQPRVLDFGVARSLEPGTDATSLRTEDGRLVGTLTTMSPEQVEGVSEGLTPACDVYSLGAMLFLLLSGRTPHDLEGLSLLGALQILQSRDPIRLGSVRRDLRGDLDRIVAKALQREPQRRYATGGELAADLGRFLRKEPILAREPSTLYELRRFVARNPALVAGIASTLLVLFAGVAVSFGQTLRARAGERLAQQQSYISSIRAVDADLRLGDSILALEDLESLPEGTRGWEWDYLVARVQDSLSLVVESVDHRAGLALLDPRGPRFAYVRDGRLWRYDGVRDREELWLTTDSPLQRISRVSASGELALAGADGSLWLVAEGERKPRLLASLPAPALDLDWCDRRQELLAMGRETMWRIDATGEPRRLFNSSESRRMIQFAYSEEAETLLVSLTRRGTLPHSTGVARAYDALTGEVRWQSPGVASGRAPSIDTTDRWAFLGTTWGEGRLMDLATGLPRILPGQSSGSARTSQFSPGGSRLYTSNGGRTLEIRELPTGAIEKRAQITPRSLTSHRAERGGSQAASEGGFSGSGLSAVWVDEGSMLIARSGGVYAWSLDFTGSERFEARDYGYDLRFSPDGRWLLFREFRGDWVLLDALLRREVARLPNWTKNAIFAADGTSILMRSGPWCRLDLGSLELLEVLTDEGSNQGAKSIKTRVLKDYVSKEHPVRIHGTQLFDARTGQLVLQGSNLRSRGLWGGAPEFEVAHEGSEPNRGLAWYSPRGWIASAHGAVRIYDDRTGQLRAALGSRSESSYSVAFHPGGERMATGGADGGIVIWETEHWAPVLTLRGHDLYVRALEFSPDGKLLASASGDRSVRLWDTRPRGVREAEIQRVLDERAGVRSTVAEWIAAGTPDLAAAVHRRFPPGPQRDAALSWMHELRSEGGLPLVSTSAPERKNEVGSDSGESPESAIEGLPGSGD